MKHLLTGQFYGQTNETIYLEGITLTDTEYTHDKVDWHYHENAYFTFILQGKVIEGNKKAVHNCSAGTLLFHNWQEAHYNIKPAGFTRGFHIEFEQPWLDAFDLDLNILQGNIHILNPHIKILLRKIFKETKIKDGTTVLSIQSLLLQTLTSLQQSEQTEVKNKPQWVHTIGEILRDQYAENLSLKSLSGIADIYPVHLSRDFSKYFQSSLGEYIRKLRIEKALSLLADKKKSLTDITFECGFSDQSHFIRCFREIIGITPSAYRKIILC
ncbi:MAG: AraC family transcriptional regulator [Chitinophagaceae bacterium]